MLLAQGVTNRGRIRSVNEDCFAVSPELGLCVVADGMGGHSAGEVASRIAVDTIVDYVGRPMEAATWAFGFDQTISEPGNLLQTAVHLANLRVFDAAAATPDYSGMGTTVVAILVRGERVSVAHAGDSRLYVYAKSQLRRLTEDDSWAATVLARDPNFDMATLRQHPMRNALTNVVGTRPNTVVHLTEHRLSGDERFILTTDGVHGVLDDAQLARLLQGHDDAQRVAAALVETALESGSRDNCTAVVADYITLPPGVR
jgi:protein phosphatase